MNCNIAYEKVIKITNLITEKRISKDGFLWTHEICFPAYKSSPHIIPKKQLEINLTIVEVKIINKMS